MENSSSKPTRIKLKDRRLDNDISFRGPLSYRWLRIIGWICLALGQIAVVLGIAMNVSKDLVPTLTPVKSVFSFFRGFALPLFLLANFAFILQLKNDFKKLLKFYGMMVGIMYLLGIFVSTFYIFRLFSSISLNTIDYWTFADTIGTLMVAADSPFYIFNIFIDLFLCAIAYFFLFYKPKKYFQGKKITLFRLMIFLPIIYEVASVVIKYLVNVQNMHINFFLFFGLTAKPPFMFLAFILIIFVIKLQQIGFMKRHNDEEYYEEHIKTNAHSFKVSITISWVFALCGLLDIVVLFFYAIGYTSNHFDPGAGVEIMDVFLIGLSNAISLGFGNSMILIIIAPFTLLFSYNKKHDNPKIDKFIPIAGIGLMVLILVQGIFEIACFKFPQLMQALQDFLNGGEEEIAPQALIKYQLYDVINTIRGFIH